jgi:DNA invertase Pin-like site-specific DNA recombinase
MVGKWLMANPDYQLSDLRFRDLGKSGFSGAHLENAFGRLLAAVETGAIPPGSKILIEAIDRAGRLEPMEMLPLLSRIVNVGVDIVTLDDGITYNRESVNSHQLFLLVAKVQQAYQYSDSLSRRIRSAYVAKRAKAAAGEGVRRRTPIWITKEGTLDEVIAPFVAQVFEDYAAGIGERRILKRLKGQHPAFETLSPSTYHRWLRNPIAVGRWNDIEDVYPPVVSKELWYRVQKKLTGGKMPRSASSKYHLSGIVKCALCGKNYCVGGQKRALTMLCITRHKYGDGELGCPNSKSIPYMVLSFISHRTSSSALQRAMSEQSLTANEKRGIEIDGKLSELSKEAANTAEGLAKYGLLPQIEAVLDRVTKEMDALKVEKAALSTAPSAITLDDVFEMEGDFINEDPIKWNALVRGVGYEIICNGREIEVVEQDYYRPSERKVQKFVYLGSQRHKGTYQIRVNDESISTIPNFNSKFDENEREAFDRYLAEHEGAKLRDELPLPEVIYGDNWKGEQI